MKSGGLIMLELEYPTRADPGGPPESQDPIEVGKNIELVAGGPYVQLV